MDNVLLDRLHGAQPMKRSKSKMNSGTFGTPDAESELLLRCCAVSGPFAESAAMRTLVERGVDWHRFLALANRNSVTPMVDAHLGAAGAANPPPHAAQRQRSPETPEKIVSYRQW